MNDGDCGSRQRLTRLGEHFEDEWIRSPFLPDGRRWSGPGVNGDVVTYVVNRNINYTNQCYFKCGFCAFSKGPRSLELRGDPYLMTIPQVVERAVEAHRRGATEVCLQGGIHPDFTGDFYITLLGSIREHGPDMHCTGIAPLQVWHGTRRAGVPG